MTLQTHSRVRSHPRIQPQYTTIDGLRIRYAEGGRGSAGPTGATGSAGAAHALLLSPWPETVFAFDGVWQALGERARLIAVDPPGFGGSETRSDLMNPKAMGDFIVRIADAFGLDHPHLVGPDIGTASTLFAAAAAPGRFPTLVVGGGASAVPIAVKRALRGWVYARDLQPYREMGGRAVVESVVRSISGYLPPDEIRADYVDSYAGDRFADTIPYAQSYVRWLPVLAELLPAIDVPVRVIAGGADRVVPPVNARFLGERLPNCRVDMIPGAGHFCWEEKPAEYGALVAAWWAEHARG